MTITTSVPLSELPTNTTKSDLEARVKEALRKQLLERTTITADTPVEEAKPAPEPEVPIALKSGQQLFSTLIKSSKVVLDSYKLKDFAVSVLDPSVLPSEVRAFVPTVNAAYNVQIDEAHALLMAWEMNEKVLITGPTGSGKSSLIEFACALTNRPLIRINMTGDIESSILFGQLCVEGGATVWKDGPITEAVKYGAVTLIDEWDVTPPEILFGLQWLFEDNGKLFLKEMPGDSNSKFLTPHDNFRLVCAGNTVGQGDDTGRYSGTNVQNNASIDRFQTTIVLDYLDKQHETKIIVANCPGLKKATADKMVSFASLIRTACKQNNINLTMSPRTLINWGRKSVVFGDMRRALILSFANKLRESDRNIVGEFYTKVFGTAL
jgi:cobaltochelatase CobS